MRIRNTLLFLMIAPYMLFSQSTNSRRILPNGGIIEPTHRVMCIPLPVYPSPSDTVVITGNCWGTKRKPTDTDATIRFHCAATKLNTEPLYVIDGVMMESSALKALDPNNIERIDILKNAAATTIYGSRANAGAVIITTKRNREFEITDQQDSAKIPGATVKFKAIGKSHDRLSFAANNAGCIITDKLTAANYEIEVSAIGYKTTTLNWCRDSLRKKIIFLDRFYTEAAPVVVVVTRQHVYRCPIGMPVNKIPATIKASVPIEKSSPAIKIFPNPLAKGQSVTIELKNMLPGEITVRITGADGRQLVYRSLTIENNKPLKLETDSRWSAGNYFIQLIRPGGEIISTGQVIIL